MCALTSLQVEALTVCNYGAYKNNQQILLTGIHKKLGFPNVRTEQFILYKKKTHHTQRREFLHTREHAINNDNLRVYKIELFF